MSFFNPVEFNKTEFFTALQNVLFASSESEFNYSVFRGLFTNNISCPEGLKDVVSYLDSDSKTHDLTRVGRLLKESAQDTSRFNCINSLLERLNKAENTYASLIAQVFVYE